MKNFSEFGIKVPEILLPADKDLSKWSVIACDQYTQDEEYWKKVQNIVKDNPSTLNIILPEVYLSSNNKKQRIEKINSTMKKYLSSGVFDPAKKEFIYVERTTSYGRIRHGLVLAVDLDDYEWKAGSKSLIRATEATIVDRLPPRKEIRKDAELESPHIMLLVNDKNHILVEAAGENAKKEGKCLYDSDLMLNSGHITGWEISSEEALEKIYSALEKLKAENTLSDGSSFLFAVGDGNHSLATAKAVWDEYRNSQKEKGVSDDEIALSPLRYALVEVVNIYDSGLTFEPIHRVLFNADYKNLIDCLREKLNGSLVDLNSEKELEEMVRCSKSFFGFVHAENGKIFYQCLKTELSELAVSRLQPLLDDFIKSSSEKIEIDYIHGSDEVFRLGKENNAITILLPPVAKDSFFATISSRGPLPRKSFSMGEASEKRFYLEVRKIR